MPYITSIERTGIMKGILQKGREDVIDVLQVRFENVPPELVDVLDSLEDPSILKTLHRQAITISSLKDFQSFLEQFKNY